MEGIQSLILDSVFAQLFAAALRYQKFSESETPQ
jgi:hypothetical protein